MATLPSTPVNGIYVQPRAYAGDNAQRYYVTIIDADSNIIDIVEANDDTLCTVLANVCNSREQSPRIDVLPRALGQFVYYDCQNDRQTEYLYKVKRGDREFYLLHSKDYFPLPKSAPFLWHDMNEHGSCFVGDTLEDLLEGING